MSTKNTISIEIPAEEQQAVNDALDTMLSTTHPYLIALSGEQRQTLPKMGDGTVPFVKKVLGYIESDPEYAPSYLDVPELKKDFAAVETLTPYLRKINQLQNKLTDTITLTGSEAYVAALTYYYTVKGAASQNVPGAKAIYEDLKKRFENQGPGKSTE